MLCAYDPLGVIADKVIRLSLHGSDLAAEPGCSQEHADALSATYPLLGLEREVDESVVKVRVAQ
jgi:hypothetical protein